MDKLLDENSLIRAEPRYKMIKNLLLWDASFIDMVLITSPMGMLGLPYLTRNRYFSAKVPNLYYRRFILQFFFLGQIAVLGL